MAISPNRCIDINLEPGKNAALIGETTNVVRTEEIIRVSRISSISIEVTEYNCAWGTCSMVVSSGAT